MSVEGRADVVVVGAGMSGLCASVAALERGARVVTVEKGTRFGGSMALSGGAMWTYVDKDRLREHIPDGNQLLQSIVVDTLSDGHDWLERHGVPMTPERDIEQQGRGRSADPWR